MINRTNFVIVSTVEIQPLGDIGVMIDFGIKGALGEDIIEIVLPWKLANQLAEIITHLVQKDEEK